jgi:hypothetical protein
MKTRSGDGSMKHLSSTSWLLSVLVLLSGGETFDVAGNMAQDSSASSDGSFGITGTVAFRTSCFSSGTITPGTFAPAFPPRVGRLSWCPGRVCLSPPRPKFGENSGLALTAKDAGDIHNVHVDWGGKSPPLFTTPAPRWCPRSSLHPGIPLCA